MSSEEEEQRVTFLRHFEQRSHREADPPLKQRTHRAKLKISPCDRIINSPYRRCRETAQLMGFHQTPLVIDTRLCEYQGAKKRREFALEEETLAHGLVPGSDETWTQCAARLDAFLEYLQTLPGHTVVVTHGIVVRYAQERLCGASEFRRGRDVPFGGGFTHCISL